MTRFSARALTLFLPLALVAAACGDDRSDSGAAPSSGDPVTTAAESQGGPSGGPSGDAGAGGPTFTAAQIGGGEFDAASIQGKDTVLWFWAPWCTTCRSEAPDVLESAAEFDGSVQVIGVAGRGEVADMEDFIGDTGTGDLVHLVDGDGSIWSQFEVISQPAFAFIDDSGDVEVVSSALGREALTERMQALSDA
jgi:thiol-disulfide isomerase/thioredoxin